MRLHYFQFSTASGPPLLSGPQTVPQMDHRRFPTRSNSTLQVSYLPKFRPGPAFRLFQ